MLIWPGLVTGPRTIHAAVNATTTVQGEYRRYINGVDIFIQNAERCWRLDWTHTKASDGLFHRVRNAPYRSDVPYDYRPRHDALVVLRDGVCLEHAPVATANQHGGSCCTTRSFLLYLDSHPASG